MKLKSNVMLLANRLGDYCLTVEGKCADFCTHTKLNPTGEPSKQLLIITVRSQYHILQFTLTMNTMKWKTMLNSFEHFIWFSSPLYKQFMIWWTLFLYSKAQIHCDSFTAIYLLGKMEKKMLSTPLQFDSYFFFVMLQQKSECRIWNDGKTKSYSRNQKRW